MIHAIVLAAAILSPNCGTQCLGRCYWSWQNWRCQDSRVAYLGTWDPVPLDYEPPRESDFPGWAVPYPKSWGSYSLEQVSSAVHETDLGWVP